MALSFLDTNILLYAARPVLAPGDEHKRGPAIALVETLDFGISGQLLAEFYYNAVKESPFQMSFEQADAWMEDLSLRPCAPVDVALVNNGVAIARRYKISYWDGAMIAAAHELGAPVFYTEDLNDGQLYGRVKVVNPFNSLSN